MIKRETVICQYKTGILGFSCIDNRWESLFYDPGNLQHRIGNIYVARVIDTPQNLDAAFVEIAKGVRCFLPLKEQLPSRRGDCASNRLREGDEIPVQIIKEAVKTKDAVVSERLSLTGKYIVITNENNICGYSNAFRTSGRSQIKEYFAALAEFTCTDGVLRYCKPYGLIFRTALADELHAREKGQTPGSSERLFEEVWAEIQHMTEQMETLLQKGKTRTIYSILHEEEPEYLTRAADNAPERIITDLREVYDRLLMRQNQDSGLSGIDIVFRDPAEYPLSKIHCVDSRITELMKPRVWLKSGAYLVIEHTEAMTVIDVNSGKNESGISHEELCLQINLESAREIMRQIRLRHISGIIVIDFMKMTSPKHNNQLMTELTSLAKKERIKTSVIDMTALGLVEMTRVKKEIFLHQLLTNA